MALVPHNECRRSIKCFLMQCGNAVHGEAVYPETPILQDLDGVVHIPDRDKRDSEGHPGRGFHHRTRDGCLSVLGDKDPREAKGRRRTNDSPNIMWILYLA